MKQIVHSRADGRVIVTQPSVRIMKAFTQGGGLEKDRKLRDRFIAHDVAGGVPEKVAVKWYDAKAEGGLTAALALGLIRDRDCRVGVDHEALEVKGFDRFFRDAWRRPPGGGHIFVDLTAARPVLVRKMRVALTGRISELETRALELLMAGDDAGEASLQREILALKSFDIRAFAIAVRDAKADSAGELKALWPAELGGA